MAAAGGVRQATEEVKCALVMLAGVFGLGGSALGQDCVRREKGVGSFVEVRCGSKHNLSALA